MSRQATLALQAAGMRRTHGAYASRKFAIKHGVLALYRLAVQLSASE